VAGGAADRAVKAGIADFHFVLLCNAAANK
jgi:hypothetical protein